MPNCKGALAAGSAVSSCGGCWMADVDAKTLRDTAKADLVAITLRDAVKFCLETARNSQRSDANIDAAKQAAVAIESARLLNDASAPMI